MKTIKESILGSTKTGRSAVIENALKEAKKEGYLFFKEYKINPDYTVSLGSNEIVMYDANYKLPFKIKDVYMIHNTGISKLRISNLSDPETFKNLPDRVDRIEYEYLDTKIKDIRSIEANIIAFSYCNILELPIMQNKLDRILINQCSIKNLKNISESEEYIIFKCNNLTDLKGIVSKNYTKIHIEDCNDLTSIDNIKGDRCEYLIIRDCIKLKSLSCSLDFCKYISVEANAKIKNFRGWPDGYKIQVYNINNLDDFTVFPAAEEFSICFSKNIDKSMIPDDLEDRIKTASGAKKIIINFF